MSMSESEFGYVEQVYADGRIRVRTPQSYHVPWAPTTPRERNQALCAYARDLGFSEAQVGSIWLALEHPQIGER